MIHDYRYKTTNLPLALQALAALRAAGVLAPEGAPFNMLGEPLPDDPTVRGRRGWGGWLSDKSGEQFYVTPVGDPAAWYFAIRSEVPPSAVPFDPAAYGLQPVSAEESAAVLGVWA
jgi:hypothetical protein